MTRFMNESAFKSKDQADTEHAFQSHPLPVASGTKSSPLRLDRQSPHPQTARTRTHRSFSKSSITKTPEEKRNGVLDFIRAISESLLRFEPVWLTPRVSINNDFWSVNHSSVAQDAIRQRVNSLKEAHEYLNTASSIDLLSPEWQTIEQCIHSAFRTSLTQRRISLSLGGLKDTLKSYSERQSMRQLSGSNTPISAPVAFMGPTTVVPALPLDGPLSALPLNVASLELREQSPLTISSGRERSATPGRERSRTPLITGGDNATRSYAQSIANLWLDYQNPLAQAAVLSILEDVSDRIIDDVLLLIRSGLDLALVKVKRSSAKLQS